MRIRSVIAESVLCLLIGATATALADVPTSMNVQGQLTSSTGIPVPEGLKIFTFKIFDAQIGGNEVWPVGPGEDQTQYVNKSGLWSAHLGAVIPLTEAVFADTARWLEITVDADGPGPTPPETLSRVKLNTVPFTYRSASSQLADTALAVKNSGGWADDGTVVRLISDTDSVGIGTTSPTANLHIVGTLHASDKANFGPNNANPGSYAFVAGSADTAGGHYSTVGGGQMNVAAATLSTIGGGNMNRVSNEYGTIGGGNSNLVTGFYGTITGGGDNEAINWGSTVGGGVANGAGNANETGGYSTVAGGSVNHATGGFSTVGGGGGCEASADYSTVGGGTGDTASGKWSTVGGGSANAASGSYGSVGGGNSNIAAGDYSIVGGGGFNRARGMYSIVAGGGSGSPVDTQLASGDWSAIGGGRGNIASGLYSTVPGGSNNVAQGWCSFAAGQYARANYSGSFVWADDIYAPFLSSSANEFSARCTGGARFVSAIDGSGNPTAGVQLPPGGGSWSSISDRSLKEEFASVDGTALLAKLVAMPIGTWKYKAQDLSIRHIGPMAQDFYTAFGVGEDSTRITTVDADGVALAAIQALYQKTKEIEQLKVEMAEMKALLQKLAAERQ